MSTQTVAAAKPRTRFELIYFNFRGRGESIRLLFEITNTPYQNSAPDDWHSLKETLPWGQLPLLIDHDENIRLSQSKAILRHIARVTGTYGSSLRDQALIDMLLEAESDWRNYYSALMYSRGQFSNYSGEIEAYKANYMPLQLTALEKLLTSNHDGHGYFVGKQLSVADVCVFDILDIHLVLAPNCLDPFPHLKAFRNRIAGIPRVVEYVNSGKRFARINGNGRGQ